MPSDDELLATLADAERVNTFMLARRWADRTERPDPAARTVAGEVDELATMAALHKQIGRWLPLQIHRALLAGATVEQAAAAAGLTPLDLAQSWATWSINQRLLQEQMPDLPDHTAEYDQVGAVLESWLIDVENGDRHV